MKKLKAVSVLSGLFILFIILFGGCGEDSVNNSNGNGNGDNLSMSVKTDNSATNPTEIIIDEAKALITEVELEQEPSGQEQHLRIEPFVIHFNMDGTLITVTSGNIPSGNYNKIKFKIHKPEDNETPPDPEFKEGTSGNQRYSFIIKGRFNGNSFIYKSRKSANLVVNFPSPINFQQEGNITILINPSLWFKNGSVVIDPRNPSNENIIDDNLKNSFKRAFKDDDRNGLPDDN
ncbi:MAG TPA: hypothetical protein VGK25_14190 [Ignavibacteria bacterium]|jgi:hypothetical protein